MKVAESREDAVPAVADPLVRVSDIRKHFVLQGRRRGLWRRELHELRAVDGISLELTRGETLGLVGESGCGKTTVGRAMLRLTEVKSGSVFFDGTDIHTLTKRSLRRLRPRMQMIFQNPYSALNTRMKVESILAEAVGVRRPDASKGEVNERVRDLAGKVNFGSEKLRRYPWELSGGERRRVGVARTLAVEPEFVIADEPVAALDLSIKSQIINLLQDLKEDHGLTYLVISHDIGMIKYLSDRVAVMYLGRVVEMGPNHAVRRTRCLHPYTQQLLTAASFMSSSWEDGYSLERSFRDTRWEVPRDQAPSGCRYHPRCSLYHSKGCPKECVTLEPCLQPADGDGTHVVSCHFAGEGQSA